MRPILSAMKADSKYRIVTVTQYQGQRKPSGWYHLTRKGERFPLAGGPMDHIMRVYRKLAQ